MYSNQLMNTHICTEIGRFNNFKSLYNYMKVENINNVKGQANYWGTYTLFDYSIKDIELLLKMNEEV